LLATTISSSRVAFSMRGCITSLSWSSSNTRTCRLRDWQAQMQLSERRCNKT
jgi:hypothetical protein